MGGGEGRARGKERGGGVRKGEEREREEGKRTRGKARTENSGCELNRIYN